MMHDICRELPLYKLISLKREKKMSHLIDHLILCATIVCDEWTELNCTGEAAPDDLEEHCMVAHQVQTRNHMLLWSLCWYLTALCVSTFDIFTSFDLFQGFLYVFGGMLDSAYTQLRCPLWVFDIGEFDCTVHLLRYWQPVLGFALQTLRLDRRSLLLHVDSSPTPPSPCENIQPL